MAAAPATRPRWHLSQASRQAECRLCSTVSHAAPNAAEIATAAVPEAPAVDALQTRTCVCGESDCSPVSLGAADDAASRTTDSGAIQRQSSGSTGRSDLYAAIDANNLLRVGMSTGFVKWTSKPASVATTTTARPGCDESPLRSWLNGSKPPAEAPTPTTETGLRQAPAPAEYRRLRRRRDLNRQGRHSPTPSQPITRSRNVAANAHGVRSASVCRPSRVLVEFPSVLRTVSPFKLSFVNSRARRARVTRQAGCEIEQAAS
jgi:hypothetical protein